MEGGLSAAYSQPSPEPPGTPPPTAPSALPEPEQPPGRPHRKRKFPVHFGNVLATSYTPDINVPMARDALFEERLEPLTVQEPGALAAPDILHPNPKGFYMHKHFTEPQETHTQIEPVIEPPPIHHPFKNDSYFEMVKHMTLTPSSHTRPGAKAIARSFEDGRIKQKEIKGFDPSQELNRLDEYGARSSVAGGPWKAGSVKLKMPCPRANNPPYDSEKDAPEFEVHGIQHRSLVDLITSHLVNPVTSKSFTGTPFTEWWCPPGSTKPIRVYGEAHSSDVAIKLYEEVKGVPPPADNPNIQNVVVLLMLGSDSTHLASFGTASIWPIYLFFGNESKYNTSKQSECPAYHLAYIPKVVSMKFPRWPRLRNHYPVTRWLCGCIQGGIRN